jgi:hypothetical protein
MIQDEATLVRKTVVHLTALLQQNVTCQASNVNQLRIKTVKSVDCVYRIQDHLHFIKVWLKFICLYTPFLLVIYCKVTRIDMRLR